LWVAAACALAAAAAGCAARGAGGASRAADDAIAIRLVLEVGAAAAGPVWIALSGAGGEVGWVSVTLAGVRVDLQERCDVPDCGVPPAVCGMAVPMVRDLTAGGGRRVEFVWDGMWSVVDSVARCETRRAAPAGDYVARFCWSREAVVEGGGGGDPSRAVQGRLVRPECAERGFGLGSGAVVVRIGTGEDG
jgi:hypothetical protein